MSILNKAYYHTWNIGFIENDIADIITSEIKQVDVHWLKHSYKDRFFADPFLLSVNENEINVLVEDFPYYDKRGVISLLTVDRKSYYLIGKKVVLEQPFHMSYPFIMRKENGDIWVSPEASASGKLYRYDFEPGSQMLKNKTLLLDKPNLDSTIIKYKGLWWMFCTQRGTESNKNLYIYFAEKPEGPYISHQNNPVLSDLSTARPGGYMVELDGALYRVCQECSRCYGEYINVTRVVTLTPTEYKEVFVKSVKAQKDEYSGGFHTINGLGGICVVDGLKTTFSPIRRLVFETANMVNSRLRKNK